MSAIRAVRYARGLVLVAALTLTLGLSGAFASLAAASNNYFQSPDKKVFCDMLTNPPALPSAFCDTLNYGGSGFHSGSVDSQGKVTICNRPPGGNYCGALGSTRFPLFHYGQSKEFYGLRCTSAHNGITCVVASGSKQGTGFRIDRSQAVRVSFRVNRMQELAINRLAGPLAAQNAGVYINSAASQSTWSRIARRAAFPVYRPLDTLGLRFNGVVLARGAPGIPPADTGCVSASWGNLQSGSHPRLAIDEPGDSNRCGQPGEAIQVATAAVNGAKVPVLVQCAAFPKCTIKDGETKGEFLLFVPERGTPHYAIQLDSAHVSLSDFLKVARSFARVR